MDEFMTGSNGNEQPEPYKASSQSPGWGDGLARQVIVEALYGSLIRTLPGAFSADLFGDPASPRAVIAKAIEDYVKEFGARPAAGILDELIGRAIESQPKAVQEAIAEEWTYV